LIYLKPAKVIPHQEGVIVLVCNNSCHDTHDGALKEPALRTALHFPRGVTNIVSKHKVLAFPNIQKEEK